MTTPKIAPCPICGRAVQVRDRYAHGGYNSHTISVVSCGDTTHDVSVSGRYENDAIAKWNRAFKENKR